MRRALIGASFFLLAGPAAAERELDISRRWCAEQGGQAEAVLPDRTRADCLTTDHVIEVERARHWAEAIGQALYYQVQTGRRAGILLILERTTDYRFWVRLGTVIAAHQLPIDTWLLRTYPEPHGAPHGGRPPVWEPKP